MRVLSIYIVASDARKILKKVMYGIIIPPVICVWYVDTAVRHTDTSIYMFDRYIKLVLVAIPTADPG